MTEAERVRLAQAALARDVYLQALIQIREIAREGPRVRKVDELHDIFVIAQTALEEPGKTGVGTVFGTPKWRG